jgi:hypothetical protein
VDRFSNLCIIGRRQFVRFAPTNDLLLVIGSGQLVLASTICVWVCVHFVFVNLARSTPLYRSLLEFKVRIIFENQYNTMPKSPLKAAQTGIAFLSIIFSIVAVTNVQWVGTETQDCGLFAYKMDGSVKNLNCDSMMSQAQCGYLQSSQNSCIISIIFLFLTFGWLIHQYSSITPMNALIAFALAFLQLSFGLTSTVVFAYFKNDFLSADDGVNVEYPVHTYSHYLWAYYIWISVTVCSFVVSSISGYELFRLTRSDAHAPLTTKGARDLEAMN